MSHISAGTVAAAWQQMARANAWANHRLLAACAKLPPADLTATRTSFFPSLIATLNHILIIDRFYVDALEGGTLGPAAWANRIPHPDFGDLDREQRAMDRRLIAFCDGLADADMPRIVRISRGRMVQEERLDRVLPHLFLHQVHHRGQAHAMMSGTGVKPPQLDEFYFDMEADLRAADFTALGWTEAAAHP